MFDDMGEVDATKKMSRRDGVAGRLKEKYKEKYPGDELDDDETLFGQIDDDYNSYDEEINHYKESERQLSDLLAKDPRNGQFLTDMARGVDPLVNVLKRLGAEGITDLLNNPEKQEEYAKANQEYVERLAKSKELDEMYERNLEESLALLDKVQAERGLSDDEIDAAYGVLSRIASNGIMGKIEEEDIDLALKAVNHDRDVMAAADEGRIAGRNQKIEEKLRKPKTGDGTPQLQGSNNAAKPLGKHRKNIFELAEEGAS